MPVRLLLMRVRAQVAGLQPGQPLQFLGHQGAERRHQIPTWSIIVSSSPNSRRQFETTDCTSAMANKRRNAEVAGKKTVSAAAKILCSPYSSNAEKAAAAAELAQLPNRTAKRNSEITGKQVANLAAKILRSPHSSPAAKRAAASALTQRAGKT